MVTGIRYARYSPWWKKSVARPSRSARSRAAPATQPTWWLGPNASAPSSDGSPATTICRRLWRARSPGSASSSGNLGADPGLLTPGADPLGDFRGASRAPGRRATLLDLPNPLRFVVFFLSKSEYYECVSVFLAPGTWAWSRARAWRTPATMWFAWMW